MKADKLVMVHLLHQMIRMNMGSDKSVRLVAEWVKVSHKGGGFSPHLT